MKGMRTFLQTFLVFLCTVVVAIANEPAKAEGGGDPYAAMYTIWYVLIGIILAWGVTTHSSALSTNPAVCIVGPCRA